MSSRVRIGVVLIPTDPWPESVACAQRVEALGYDHLWVYDHLSWRRYRDEPWHATYPWLTGIASATDRIGLGTLVSNLNIRHPVTLAKDAITIDHISKGRLTIGIGAAGTGFDATVLGQAPLTPRQRVERLEEFTVVFDGLLRGTLRDHTGAWYEVCDARMLPGCVQAPRVPIAIAAGGKRSIRLAAEQADAWITFGDTTGEEMSAAGTERVVRDQMRLLDQRCEEVGRDETEIDRVFVVGLSEERPLASIEQFVDFVGRYRSIGFTDVVFHHPRRDDPTWNDDPEIVDEISATLLVGERPADD